MKRLSVFSVVIALAMIMAACAPVVVPTATPEPPMPEPTPTAVPSQTIVDIAVADGRFTTLVAALQAADLVETLSGDGPFTVFAPTDDAFAKLPAGTVDALLADIPQLTEILTYHVVAGKVMAADVVALDSAKTVNGLPVYVKVDNGKVFINGAEVLITDIEADNGVIHVIDSVILPPADIVDTAIADGRFTTLVAAVQAAGLVDTLKSEGPFTVFAPTDDAFAKLPAGTVEALLADIPQLTSILTYHVVPELLLSPKVLEMEKIATVNGKSLTVSMDMGKPMIDNAEIIITDVYTSNGVIHVIDSVLIPGKDIVETAIADGRFTTLVAAVQAAELVETLQGEGPFTVFAPTDDAFKKLPAGTVEALLKDIPTLKNILLYHVVSGKVMAADVVKLTSADSVLGKPLSIEVKDGKVYVAGSQVIITDIETTNGVIHVIDTVMLP